MKFQVYKPESDRVMLYAYLSEGEYIFDFL